MNQITFSRVFVAFLLIVFGVLLLLVNINVISLEINEVFVTFYPLLFLILGLKWLVESILSNGRKGWFSGFFLLLFGILLSLDRLGYITFTFWMVWKLWPLLLIYIGMKLFSKNNKGSNSTVLKKSALPIGTLSNQKGTWSLEPMNVWMGVGDIHYDFSKAFIPDQDTEIVLSGWVGDVTLLIPEDVAVSIDAMVKTGSIEVFDNETDGLNRKLSYKSATYDEETRRLTISINLSVGSIQVDKV